MKKWILTAILSFLMMAESGYIVFNLTISALVEAAFGKQQVARSAEKTSGLAIIIGLQALIVFAIAVNEIIKKLQIKNTHNQNRK